ncbi:MAG: putative 4-hydroxybenzoate polyprenyltransferase [Desulfurococcales archaeon]|nr:putative 4-hydroxybenzoate polyprenyltransferase [Desulfurococcales archaeon]
MNGWDPGKVREKNKIHAVLRLIRIEHTLFSLPFAYAGAILSGYNFTLRDAVLIGLALFGLRTAAMAYNNIADLDIDRLNPRSSKRPLVTGVLSVKDAYLVVLIGTVLYYLSAALLNKYALLFSPILWLLAMTYPYAKRLHWLPHIHLGLVLGYAVFGGAVAASGDELTSVCSVLVSVPWSYVFGVTFWVAGFDVIYSIMDIDFDRAHSLGSVPARLGVRGAFFASLLFYFLAGFFFLYGLWEYRVLTGGLTLFSTLLGITLMITSWLIAYKDLDKIPVSFNLNLLVGILVSIGVILDYLKSLV